MLALPQKSIPMEIYGFSWKPPHVITPPILHPLKRVPKGTGTGPRCGRGGGTPPGPALAQRQPTGGGRRQRRRQGRGSGRTRAVGTRMASHLRSGAVLAQTTHFGRFSSQCAVAA